MLYPVPSQSFEDFCENHVESLWMSVDKSEDKSFAPVFHVDSTKFVDNLSAGQPVP